MQIRDRIRELRRVRAGDLRPHPLNWRTHPPAQQDALRGVLAEIGYADALLVRELEDGSLQLIDGHLRAETTPDAAVPVLVLDVSAEEARQILLTHDSLAGLAGVDADRLNELLAETSFECEQITNLLTKLADDEAAADELLGEPAERPEVAIPETYQVVIDCDDEAAQRELYDRLTQEGYRCRVLTL